MVKVRVGDIYWDCAYHPVLCTESYRVKNNGLFSYNHDIAGVSLFDGSEPRACSVEHCGVIVLNSEQIAWLIQHRDDFYDAEVEWREGKKDAYINVLKAWDNFIGEA